MRIEPLLPILAAGATLAFNPGQVDLPGPVPPNCASITAATVDDCVRLNQIQVLGTHNSYHVAPVPAMRALLGDRGRDLDYTHKPLTAQLTELGVRQFELDVFADPTGGRFERPAAPRIVKRLEPAGPEMRSPGFKVRHMPDIDYGTTCPTLVACLLEIRDWSRANPSHVPILIMIEVKDQPISDPDARGFVTPIPVDANALRALDAEIRSVFDERHLLTPDRVRGRHTTLSGALQTDGWPLLRAARGKVLFALDNTDGHRADYLRGNSSLEGRVLFVSSAAGEPSAAFVKMNEVLGDDEERIRQTVRGGYLVRTRADIPTDEARTGNTSRRDAAFRSGAQFVSTDYPQDSPFGSGYRARLPGAEQLPARCNPVTAPPACRNEWLEPDHRKR
jgi:hypothetical protein